MTSRMSKHCLPTRCRATVDKFKNVKTRFIKKNKTINKRKSVFTSVCHGVLPRVEMFRNHSRPLSRGLLTRSIPYITFFLPRDAMRRRGLCCRPVSVLLLSVRVTVIVSTRLKISSNFFLGPVAHHSSFFEPKRRYSIPTGTPSAWA